MGFIKKKTEALVNVKLTDLGRRNLSQGNLNFTKFALGDSELDYRNADDEGLRILRPADNQHDIVYKIPREGVNDMNLIDKIQSLPIIISNSADTRGFFSSDTTPTLLTTSGMTKMMGLCVEPSDLDGSVNLILRKFTGTTVNTTDIVAGDYLLLKIVNEKIPTGTTISHTVIDTIPLQYVWYQVQGVSSGATSGSVFTVTVDRPIPKSIDSGNTSNVSYAYIYSGPNLIDKYLDYSTPEPYWGSSSIDFTSNCDVSSDDVPVWNLDIAYRSEPIGLFDLEDKPTLNTSGNTLTGLYSLMNYVNANKSLQAIGVVHYTNNSISNFYGEGFHSNSFQLTIPTLMWHNRQFGGTSQGDKIGYTFVCDSEIKKILEKIEYYDLVDQETPTVVVGKVFPNLKIAIIEHQELLAALSLKSGRNWTLPKPSLSIVDAGICSDSTSEGIITAGESIHVTYMLRNTSSVNNYNVLPCMDYNTIGIPSSGSTEGKDVLFQFPKDTSVSGYSVFPYLKQSKQGGTGWWSDNMDILIQKTAYGELPNPDEWKIFNANNFMGGDGCATKDLQIENNYELYSQTIIVTDEEQTLYDLDYTPIGEVIVTRNQQVLTEAQSSSFILSVPSTHPLYSTVKNKMGDFKYLSASDQISFALNLAFYPIDQASTQLNVGDVIQFHYLKGVSTSSATIKQSIVVPATINTGLSGIIYSQTGTTYLDLDDTPAGATYVFFNGMLLSSNNYDVENNSGTYRVGLNFTPPAASRLTLYYLSATASGSTNVSGDFIPIEVEDIKIYLNAQTLTDLAVNTYKISDYITLPSVDSTTGHTLGDENFFYGNINTDIKATIYQSNIIVNVLPNRFINSVNPTFNANVDKVGFTEIGIYDEDDDMVAIGKFSQPIKRTLNSDTIIIKAVIDF